MSTLLPLEDMSINDKLIAMEELWADLSKNSENISSPEWHHDVLEKRSEKVASGEDCYYDFQKAKEHIQSRLGK